MLVIEHTILTSLLKFSGFNSIYIVDSDSELEDILSRLKCAMVVTNPAVNAYGFIQQFLGVLHTSTTDLLYRHGFSKENFINMPGISRHLSNTKAIDAAYSEYMSAMAEYSRLLVPKDNVRASFNLRNQTMDIELLSNNNVKLVVPTIVKTNKLTQKKSFSILDTSVSKVFDVFEHTNYAYSGRESISNISKRLFGASYKASAGDMIFRVIRTINYKFSSYIGFAGVSSASAGYIKSAGVDPELTLAHHSGIETVVVRNTTNTRHSCATFSSLDKILPSNPFDSFIFNNTRVYASLDRMFGKDHNLLKIREYINADEVLFYCQVDTGESIEYDMVKPCDNCPNFMGRVSTAPRCTFMSWKCNNVEYVPKGLSSWRSIKYKSI